MSLSDPIGDMLTRIRNAQMRRRDSVTTPASTLRARVLDVLKAEGYIRGYSETKYENGLIEYDIELKYDDQVPVIREIERVSRPGRRVYASVKNIPQVASGLGVSILSTPKGVMADHEARANNVGGEVLCRVF
jgi:small subunit ribosomal protein S8